MKAPWTNLLVLRFSSIGDIIQTTSVLNTLKKYCPDISINYLTLSKYEPLLIGHPSIDNLYTFNTGNTYSSLVELRKIIKQKNFDLILDLHNSTRTKIIRGLSNKIHSLYVTKPRVKRFSLFLNHQNKFSSSFNQKTWLHKPIEQLLPKKYKISKISLSISSEEKKLAIKYLNENGLENRRYFVVIPGAAWPQKQWGIEKYISLIKQCIVKYDLTPILLGSEIDIICNDINQGLDSESINMVGKTDLRQSMAIISQSSLCIGSDTGFIYASEALEIKTIAILGPTSIETGAGVFSKNTINIEDNNLWCRPCSQNGSFPCYRAEQYCMSNITPKEVIKNVEKILA
tara:strand:- start:7398 stop:8429 length:1032 start_codon:yes stop_codon:yes gene_type:complete